MSAQKRPVSSEDIENAITRIEQNIRRKSMMERLRVMSLGI